MLIPGRGARWLPNCEFLRRGRTDISGRVGFRYPLKDSGGSMYEAEQGAVHS